MFILSLFRDLWESGIRVSCCIVGGRSVKGLAG